MYSITEDLLPLGRQVNRPGTPISVRGIVSHRTGNAAPSANARLQRQYFAGGYRAASAHYFVDSERILRIIPETEMAWHAGRVTARDWRLGNPNTWAIGIELCENHPLDSPAGRQAYQRYVWLHADVCQRHRLDPRRDVYGHFQIDPDGRPLDPVGLFDWATFLDDVARALSLAQSGERPPVAVRDAAGRALCGGWLDGDRTVVPLRELAVALGLGVEWDPAGPAVTLRWPGAKAEPG